MTTRQIRNIILGIIVLGFIVMAFARDVDNWYYYIVSAVLILLGVKATLDFLMGHPMRIGGASATDSEIWRVVILIMGIGLVILGLLGMFVWK